MFVELRKIRKNRRLLGISHRTARRDAASQFVVDSFPEPLQSDCAAVRVLIIIIIIIIYCHWVLPGGSGYFTCIQNMKLVTNKFKSGGLHEKHVVATWNLGNHLSICF